jgi:hypothetical protein
VSRARVYAAVGIAAVVWGAVLLVQGIPVNAAYVRPYSFAVAGVVVAIEVFDRWLWRIGPVPRLARRPLLQGTWKGRLKSNWIDPGTRKGVAPREAYLVVSQTFSTLQTRLLTKESSSASLAGSIDDSGDGLFTVQWTYRNAPNLLLQGRSRIHHGAASLPPSRLVGFYWTDRDTKGELEFVTRSDRVHSDFKGAAADRNWRKSDST